MTPRYSVLAIVLPLRLRTAATLLGVDSMPRPIRFLLNGEPRQVSGVDPHTSVLQWLREEAGLTGSKEGCNEGDCGACTVLIGRARAGRLALAPINACIRLLPTIDGQALFTVEALSQPGRGALHPVQQAMVDMHASQCGFCTPGFVMTLVALFKQTTVAPSHERVCEAISGNLCRCTGYRPIVAAAQAMHRYAATAGPAGAADQDAPGRLRCWLAQPGQSAEIQPAERALLDALSVLDDGEALDYEAAGVRFTAPRSPAAFADQVAGAPGAWIVAGATDVGLWINKALRRTDTLIYSGAVDGFERVDTTETTISIGAAVTLAEAFDVLDRHYPEFAHVWRRFASWPIRSSGTLVGNVANGSPIGDSLPVLIALGATAVLQHGATERRLPLEALYLDYRAQAREPGEWLRAVEVPSRRALAGEGERLVVAAYKNSKRAEQDISAVLTALAIAIDAGGRVVRARIACGGMAGIVRRAPAAEAALLDQPWCEAAVTKAAEAVALDFEPLSDHRAGADYRLQVARAHLLRAWREWAGGEEVRVC